MNEQITPSSASPDIATRLSAIEATAEHNASVLSANTRAVELLIRRYYDLLPRIAAVERALARRDAADD